MKVEDGKIIVFSKSVGIEDLLKVAILKKKEKKRKKLVNRNICQLSWGSF